jgi:carboxymethylenebutenolidase
MSEGDGSSPTYDLGAVFEEHMADEFELRSAEATMTTMVDDPVVVHVPTSIGGRGYDDVLRFYRDYFVNTFPPDFEVTQLSRTVDTSQLVDEMVLQFTHSCTMPCFLPGIAPTGKAVRLPLVAIVGFVDGKVASEHLYWDQASLLVQVGLLDPATLPTRGAEEAAVVESHDVDNALLPGW